ncbi:Fc receptor-like protein 2 isoform X14 [Acinonyx jubatus]|uniref:Fc receptor-like protein 2 isoform X14 n=1 Tax=Acinonyx jubatus TaxID=32536 RepID=A0ABM3NZS3_ACIJB|nr:Fc receptor-like protein 2 isoform X14 [Acinonyx jubatus]
MLLWSLLVILAPVDGKSDWLTLVAPSAVFEGDRIDLTCQRKNNWWKVTRVSYHKDGEELQFSSELSNFSIQRAVLSDSGTYHCAVALVWPLFPFQKEKTSRSVRIEVQELFPRPVLTVSPFRAIEGNPVTLTCETKLSPQRSDAQLRFCFFRDGRALGSGWSSSPELRVPVMWSGDSGSYWCEAETVTPSVRKQSLQSQIHMRRVPVSNVSLEMRAPRGQVIEGRNLVLLCSVTEGTGNITFSWHREATGTSVGKKTQRSLSVELEVPAVQERDAGRYYCRADNGHGPIQSKVLSILVRKHSGNYSCEADNGLGARRSEVVPLSLSGTSSYREEHVTDRALGLLGVPACVAAALLFCCRFHKTRAMFFRFPHESPRCQSLPSSHQTSGSKCHGGPAVPDLGLSPGASPLSDLAWDVLPCPVPSSTPVHRLPPGFCPISPVLRKKGQFHFLHHP